MSPRRRAVPRPAIHRHPAPENAATGQPGALRPVFYVVPGKPIGQNRPGGRTKGGQKARRVPHGVKTPEQRAFATALAVYGQRARLAAGWETTHDRVEVWITVVMPSARSDADSPLKAILDSLEVSRPHMRRPGAGFLANDRQARNGHWCWDVDAEHPRVEITIARYAPPVVAPTPEFVNAWEAVHEHGQGHPRDGAEATTAGRAYLDGASP